MVNADILQNLHTHCALIVCCKNTYLIANIKMSQDTTKTNGKEVVPVVAAEEEEPNAKKRKLDTEMEIIRPVAQPGLLLLDSTSDLMARHVQDLLYLMFNPDENNEINEEILLLTLIYLEAIEIGFVTVAEYEQLKNELQPVTFFNCFNKSNVQTICTRPMTFSHDKGNNLYTIQLVHLEQALDPESPPIIVSLSCAVQDGELRVTAVPPEKYKIGDVVLPLQFNEYLVANTNVHLFGRLQNLQDFSISVRDGLLLPICLLYKTFY